MSDYSLYLLAGVAGAGMFIPLGIYMFNESVLLAMKGRSALESIRNGGNCRDYWEVFSEIRADGIAGKLIGGRRALMRAVREGREIGREIVDTLNDRE